MNSARVPREFALPAFGDVGVSVLERALDEPQSARLLNHALANALADMGPSARGLLPRLLERQRRAPDSVPLLRALGAIAADDPAVSALLERALQDEDPKLRSAALAVLSKHSAFFSQSSPSYYAALIDASTGKELAQRMGRVLEAIRPHRGAVTLVYHVRPLARFPWLAARAAFVDPVPLSALGSADETLGAVSTRLLTALRDADLDAPELGALRTGFHLAARLEGFSVTARVYRSTSAGATASAACCRLTTICWTCSSIRPDIIALWV